MVEEKRSLNFFGLWNMNVGFFGIQFGWALQMANMSAIFERLGASAEEIPILWLAAPLTGLVVQPIVGQMSDRTWGPLGRRRPYFLAGAIFSSLALLVMPHSSSLLMAALCLWVLDTSNNISMEPFRAFVGDLLPDDRRTQGFAMQSFFIGAGSVIASILPWFLSHILEIDNTAATGRIPATVTIAFTAGAIVYFGTVAWTVFSTEEYPPEDLEAFERENNDSGTFDSFKEIYAAFREMPEAMGKLAWVQFFSWFGMFCVFLYFPPAIARNIFGAVSESSELYAEGIEWAGICIAAYNFICTVFAFILPRLADRIGRKNTHAFGLFCGATGLVSLWFIHDPYLVLISTVGLGIAWSSLLSMPYAMLVSAVPEERTGVYLGIFNAFIVIPQIVAALGFGWVMQQFLGDDRLLAVVCGGIAMLVAAVLTGRIDEGEVVDVKESMNYEG